MQTNAAGGHGAGALGSRGEQAAGARGARGARALGGTGARHAGPGSEGRGRARGLGVPVLMLGMLAGSAGPVWVLVNLAQL